jgi:hypothetical protein
MLNPISSASHVQAVFQPVAAPKPQASSTQKAQPAKSDTVQLSSAARAPSAAAQLLKEAAGTSAQTALAASTGNVQAKNLLTGEATAK